MSGPRPGRSQPAALGAAANKAVGLDVDKGWALVEPAGIEPATSTMPL